MCIVTRFVNVDADKKIQGIKIEGQFRDILVHGPNGKTGKRDDLHTHCS